MRIPHNVSYEVLVNMRRAHYKADAGGAHTVVMGLRETATRLDRQEQRHHLHVVGDRLRLEAPLQRQVVAIPLDRHLPVQIAPDRLRSCPRCRRSR